MTSQKDIIVAVAVSVGVAFLLIAGNNFYQEYQRNKALVAQRGEVITSTAGTVERVPAVQQEQQRVEVVVSDARTTWQNNTQEDQRREPTLRDRATQPRPDSVRQRARERRLARERSAGAVEPGTD